MILLAAIIGAYVRQAERITRVETRFNDLSCQQNGCDKKKKNDE